MSWLNDFQWILLLLLIMKLLLLWLVATWVVTVTADRPCAEYCVYLSSGIRDIEFQTGCDCMYEEPEQEDAIGARILYEPARLLPDYIHNRPFYILNPITSRRQAFSTNSNPVIPEIAQASPNVYVYYPDRELNENTYSTQNRQEKDIRSISQRLNTHVYLDVDVDLEDIERSASSNTLTPEELKVTEQTLLECANLYTILYYRKNTDTKDNDITGLNQSSDYSHTSNEELEKNIQNKCSHITFIVEESLNEIKKTRSKITSVTYRMNNNKQQNNEGSHSNGIEIKNKQTLCSSNDENYSKSSIQNEHNESTIKEHNVDHEQTTISHTDSSENTLINKLSSEVFSTVTDITPIADFQSVDIHTTTEKNIERQGSPPIYSGNNYAFHEETDATMASTSGLFTAAALTSKDEGELDIIRDKQAEKGLKLAEVERHSENRAKYEEGEVPLIKIITQEFNNDTVQSFINGTEDIPNGDFSDELKPVDVDKQTKDSTEVLTNNQFARSMPPEETRTPNIEDQMPTETELSGNLYFLFDDEQIPARFVQSTNGSLHLGIDGVSLCNTLTENTERQSVLLKNLCNCYASDNCTHRKTD